MAKFLIDINENDDGIGLKVEIEGDPDLLKTGLLYAMSQNGDVTELILSLADLIKRGDIIQHLKKLKVPSK